MLCRSPHRQWRQSRYLRAAAVRTAINRTTDKYNQCVAWKFAMTFIIQQRFVTTLYSALVRLWGRHREWFACRWEGGAWIAARVQQNGLLLATTVQVDHLLKIIDFGYPTDAKQQQLCDRKQQTCILECSVELWLTLPLTQTKCSVLISCWCWAKLD